MNTLYVDYLFYFIFLFWVNPSFGYKNLLHIIKKWVHDSIQDCDSHGVATKHNQIENTSPEHT
jgi:hypothetical protein